MTFKLTIVTTIKTDQIIGGFAKVAQSVLSYLLFYFVLVKQENIELIVSAENTTPYWPFLFIAWKMVMGFNFIARNYKQSYCKMNILLPYMCENQSFLYLSWLKGMKITSQVYKNYISVL